MGTRKYQNTETGGILSFDPINGITRYRTKDGRIFSGIYDEDLSKNRSIKIYGMILNEVLDPILAASDDFNILTDSNGKIFKRICTHCNNIDSLKKVDTFKNMVGLHCEQCNKWIQDEIKKRRTGELYIKQIN